MTRFARPELGVLGEHSPGSEGCPVRLDSNESPFDFPAALKARALDELRKTCFNRYPQGLALSLKAALAGNLGVSSDSLVLGNGVDEVIQMILLAFGPGRRVVVPVPSFSEYSERALVAGARVSQVPLTREFDLDVDGVVAGATAAGADPCLIFICNPHNPSGKLFARDAIEAILKDTSAMVIVDEAYAEFAGCTCLNLLPAHERLVVLRTLSKAFGLAGVRVGYAVAREDLAAELSRVRQPFNMDSLSLVIARIAVEDSGYVRDNVSAVLAERSRVFQELAAIPGIAPFPSRANFVLFRTAGFAVRVWERLRSEGIALRRFARDPVLNDCLRVTIGTAAENSAFLDALRGIMERSRPAEDSRPAQNSRFAEDGGVRHA